MQIKVEIVMQVRMLTLWMTKSGGAIDGLKGSCSCSCNQIKKQALIFMRSGLKKKGEVFKSAY